MNTLVMLTSLQVVVNEFPFTESCRRGVEKAFQKQYSDEHIKTRVGYTGGSDRYPTYKKVDTRVSLTDCTHSPSSLTHFCNLLS